MVAGRTMRVPKETSPMASRLSGAIAKIHLVSSLALVLLPLAAAAHHSRANFLNEVIVLQGEVVRFRWTNPHALIYVTVRGADGKTAEWELETTATPTLVRSGWTANSLQ